MKPANLHEFLQVALGESFECSLTHLGAVQVRTPFVYPDGDLVDIFVESQDSCFLVTDYGETWGQIQMQSFSNELTWDQQRKGEKVCQRWGVGLDRRHLVAQVADRNQIRDAVHILGKAATELSATWLELAPMTRVPAVDRSDDDKRRGTETDSGLDF